MSNTEARKTPAPYGQSCTNCVRAKCRCILRETGKCERWVEASEVKRRLLTVCQRCHRLSKECTPSTSVRQRGAKRNTPSKRSQLESKLDDLVSLLRTQNVTENIVPISQNDSVSTSSSMARRNPENALFTPPSSLHSSQPFVSNPVIGSPFPSTSSSTVSSDSPPTLTDQDLRDFREDRLRYLPFIHIPETTTAAQLQSTRPITCAAIQATCFKAHPRQEELSRNVRKTLAERILVDGERSLDLLLGVLVLMAW